MRPFDVKAQKYRPGNVFLFAHFEDRTTEKGGITYLEHVDNFSHGPKPHQILSPGAHPAAFC